MAIFVVGVVLMVVGLIVLLVGIIVLKYRVDDCDNPPSGKTPPKGCSSVTYPDPGWYTIISGIILFFLGVTMMVWGAERNKAAKTVKIETTSSNVKKD